MRTIKFRGKSLYSKEWVYGYLHKCVGSTEFMTFDYNGNVARTPVSLNHTWILVPRLPDSVGWDTRDTFIDYEVDPETVGQFTGLLDKNGKEIYGGDIVEWCFWDSKQCEHFLRGYIKWHQGGFIFSLIKNDFEDAGYYAISDLNTDTESDVEVLGNIFDNPELLEGGEK